MEVGGWRLEKSRITCKASSFIHHHPSKILWNSRTQNLTKLQTPHQSKNEREIQFTIVTDSLGSEPTQTAGREGQIRRTDFEFVMCWTLFGPTSNNIINPSIITCNTTPSSSIYRYLCIIPASCNYYHYNNS